MPLRKAEITRHAWLQFLKRWEGDPPECYRTELERLLAEAAEVNLGYGATIRMMKNDFEPARYFEVENWRFVTDEEITKIVTIEHPYMTSKRPKRKIRDSRRYGK